jgi:hypothetical protein
MKAWWFLLPWSLFTGAAQACHDNVIRGLGPIMVRSEAPTQALRLTPMPRDPHLLCPSESQFRFMANVVSVWARETKPPTYLLDYQMLDTRVAYVAGLADGWAYEVSYNDRRMVKVGIDQLAIAFHDLIGFSNDGHDEVERDDIRISIPSYGVEMDEENTPLYARSFEATLSRHLVDGNGALPDSALSLTVRKSLQSDSPFENGGVDTGLELSMAWPMGRNFLYMNLAYTLFGTSKFVAIPLKDKQFVGMAAYEWRVEHDESFLMQYLYTEGVVGNLGNLSEPAHELYIGYKWRLPEVTVELGLIENLFIYNNSPDFGFSFGLVYPL